MKEITESDEDLHLLETTCKSNAYSTQSPERVRRRAQEMKSKRFMSANHSGSSKRDTRPHTAGYIPIISSEYSGRIIINKE